MKAGSVIVDLAVERGGNVEGAVAGQVVTTANDVKIIGHINVPGRVAASASLLYAKNLFAFLETMVDKEKKELAIDMEDELVKATMLTHDGSVVHPNFKDAAAAAAPAKADPQVAKAAEGTEPGLEVAPKKAPARKSAAKGTGTAKTTRRKAAPKADEPKSGGDL